MKKIGLAVIAFFALTASAFAAQQCGTVFSETGTVVQYKSANGTLHPGFLLLPNGSNWNLVWFSASTGAGAVASNVPLDQTQATNNSYASLSCSVPF